METTDFIWHNGKFVPWKDAQIHVINHARHYATGVFEGIRSYETINNNSAIFRLQDHMKRLIKGRNALIGKEFRNEASLNKIKSSLYSQEQLEETTLKLLILNELKEGYIRPIIGYGEGNMGVNPGDLHLDTTIAVWPWGKYLGVGPAKIKIPKIKRLHPDSTHIELKFTGHYLNSALAVQEVKHQGYTEALLLDHEGNASEGSGQNIFMVKNNELYTPKRGNILPGITRDSIIQISKNEGIKVNERDIKPEEIFNADEVFFTGTAVEVHEIGSVNDIKIGNGEIGPITSLLKEKYLNIVRGKNPNYKHWLTYVY